jgi:hypothetical protein
MQNLTKTFTFSPRMILLASALIGSPACFSEPQKEDIPNLVGVWTGENTTYSEQKGHSSWAKTVEISEQKGRIFKGHFTFSGGSKHFFGAIYPDNASFTWVGADSKGYNHGRIFSKDHVSACYVESGAEATVGCADLVRKKP